VVDDDFRVAQVHAGFVGEAPGFTVVGSARTAVETRARVRELAPDLVLLDIYLPDASGLDLLVELPTDAIVLSAASDAESVHTALRRGALNYLIKPFTAQQLADRLAGYARFRAQLAEGRSLGQKDVDRAVRALHESDRSTTPKGQASVTSKLISEALRSADGPRSAAEIAADLGIARATAQRYLGTLAESGAAQMGLRYGATGRPEHEYRWSGSSR
jgi:two-component system CitB family response regulator